MVIYNPTSFFQSFPNLTPDRVHVTSPVDKRYNCIAWAAGDNRRWWWPAAQAYWPPGAPRIVAVESFVAAYGTQGFRPVAGSALEPGKEKIALYTLNGIPTHAARQLQNGRWTSKCGGNVDLEHELSELEGPSYGQATHFLVRAYPIP